MPTIGVSGASAEAWAVAPLREVVDGSANAPLNAACGNESSALATFTLPAPRKNSNPGFRWLMVSTLEYNVFSIWALVKVGLFAYSSAAQPATTGDDMDVPERFAKLGVPPKP